MHLLMTGQVAMEDLFETDSKIMDDEDDFEMGMFLLSNHLWIITVTE
jgi:hypothetical protein